MVIGMAMPKITVTLPVEQVDAIKRLVEAGEAPSVSGFLQRAVATALDDAQAWDDHLADALQRTGGPLSDDERAWADAALHRSAGSPAA
jgi:Arc/MetJ-type ribon-helix-helix transcriptional regulator